MMRRIIRLGVIGLLAGMAAVAAPVSAGAHEDDMVLPDGPVTNDYKPMKVIPDGHVANDHELDSLSDGQLKIQHVNHEFEFPGEPESFPGDGATYGVFPRAPEENDHANGGPVNNVPEPATWLMMMAGFWLVAWRLRKRGHAGQETVPAAA